MFLEIEVGILAGGPAAHLFAADQKHTGRTQALATHGEVSGRALI